MTTLKIRPITYTNYQEIIQKCQPIFEKLKQIVVDSGEQPEGSVVYEHQSFNQHSHAWAIHINLMTLAQQCSRILEIGFNMGHSSTIMLMANPECSLVGIDICEHKYTIPCFEYLSTIFPGRLTLKKGRSHDCLSTYSGPLVDMLHIDGCHEYNVANVDYFLGREKVKKDGIIVFDDTWMEHLQKLWNGYIRDGHMQEIEILPAHIPKKQMGHRIGKLIAPQTKIAVATIAIGDEYKKIVKYGQIGKEHYCRKHNYDFRTDEDVHDKTRPYAWSKVPLILKCLQESYEYVVWIDADTHIMNMNLKLEDFITRLSEGKDILLTMDSCMINSGVMFIKNTEWSKKFFTTLYEQTDFLHHPNWEQGAIIHMYDTNMIECRDHMTVLPSSRQCEFNSYYNIYEHGQFLIHLAGNTQENGINIGDGRLKTMMDRNCPLRMDEETEWDYICRMRFLGRMPPHSE